LPCTAGLERRDYLDFLPKRPQGTTKILGTSAFAGTKTPAALKSHSKDATTDCAETPVNCPHCGQKWRLRRRLRRQPFILLSFSSSKKARKAQETQSYQRFQCIGHTDFKGLSNAVTNTHPLLPSMVTTRQKSSCRNRLQNGPHSLLRMKVGTHTRLCQQDRTQRLTRRNRGCFGWGRYYYPRSVSHISENLRGQVSERQTLPLLRLDPVCSRRTQRAFGTAMRLCASLFRGAAAPLGCVIFSVSVEIYGFTPRTQGFLCVRGGGGITTPGVRCVLPKFSAPACQSSLFAVF